MVIPVHDINPLRRTPWVTYVLIAINVIVLLLTPVAAGTVATGPGQAALCRQAAFYDRYAAIPRELAHNQPLRLVPTGQIGIDQGSVGCVIARPGYRKIPFLSVLYSMFLHAGWLHLLGNMLFLLVFGNNVEDRLGRLRYLLFYLACGFVAAYGFAFANAGSVEPIIGASGAIAGVLGAYLALYPRARVWCRSCSSSRCGSRPGSCSACGSCCNGPTRPALRRPAPVRSPTWRTYSASSPGWRPA